MSNTPTALAVTDDQSYWQADQLAVLRANGIDDDVTKPELQAFLHECQRRRLDPFAKQIYLIGRWDPDRQRKVYRSQTSIDGFRLVARRAADEAHEKIEYEDTIWYDADGRKHEVWISPAPPAACKFVVLRDGKRFPAVARFDSYAVRKKNGELTRQWQIRGDGQIEKCAEALALRKAFPEDLGGLYTDDEMGQADNPQAVTAQVAPDDQPRTERPADPVATGEQNPWDTGGTPEGTPVQADPGWFDEALARAGSFTTEEAGRALWREVAAARRNRIIGENEARELGTLINAQIADLKAGTGDVIEGQVVTTAVPPVTGLDPEDSWYAKVESVTSSEDAAAAIADVQASKSLTKARKDAVIAAIRAREAAILGRSAA